MDDRSDDLWKRAGFTFIEVLVVLAIVGVIAALVVPASMRADGLSDITCYSGGVQTFSAKNAKNARRSSWGSDRYSVATEAGVVTISGPCVVVEKGAR